MLNILKIVTFTRCKRREEKVQ